MLPVLLARRDLKDLLADPLVLPAQPELSGPRDLRVAPEARQVLPVLKGLPAPQVLPVFKELPALLDRKASQVQRVYRVLQAPLDLQGLGAQRVQLALVRLALLA